MKTCNIKIGGAYYRTDFESLSLIWIVLDIEENNVNNLLTSNNYFPHKCLILYPEQGYGRIRVDLSGSDFSIRKDLSIKTITFITSQYKLIAQFQNGEIINCISCGKHFDSSMFKILLYLMLPEDNEKVEIIIERDTTTIEILKNLKANYKYA